MKKRSVIRILGIFLCAVMILSLTGCKSGAVKNAEKLIAAIGEVTADSKEAVEAAEAAYEALSDSDKAKVEGVDALKSARDDLDKALRVKNVADLIDAVGAEITVESKEAVEAAEAALAALPEAEKTLVSNAAALTAARTALDEARRQAVLGTWTAEIDGTESVVSNLAIGFDIAEEEAREMVGDFKFLTVLTLREDNTYSLKVDGDRLKTDAMAMFETLRPFFRDMLIQALGEGFAEAGIAGDLSTQEGIEAALGAPLDDILKASVGATMEELLDQMMEQLSEEMDPDNFVMEQEGNFLLDVDKCELAFSEQLNDEADPANGERYRLDGDTLEIYEAVGEPFFEGKYPVVFTRVP